MICHGLITHWAVETQQIKMRMCLAWLLMAIWSGTNASMPHWHYDVQDYGIDYDADYDVNATENYDWILFSGESIQGLYGSLWSISTA